MKPVAQDGARGERSGLADQYEEGALEGVLGVGRVTQDAAAHAEHHRAVPSHQGNEGRLVPPGEELAQELPVGLVRAALGAEPPEKLRDSRAGSFGGHRFPRSAFDSVPTHLISGAGGAD